MRRRFFLYKYFDYSKYFNIEALEDGFFILLYDTAAVNNIQYSINGGSWRLLGKMEETPPINTGDILSLKSNVPISNIFGDVSLICEKRCRIFGNANSLCYGDNADVIQDYSSLNLAGVCQYWVGLIEIAKDFLPATTLADYCYNQMFQGCTSLTTAPELPATTLADYCYQYMFYGCTNLNYIKMLATDISATNCLNYWVSGVASSGTFVKASNMTSLPTGVSGIPSGWTVQNA